MSVRRRVRQEPLQALTMPQSVLARSTAEELRRAAPRARQAQTMTAPRELQAPRSSAHPTRLRPARPKRAPRSAAAPMPREAGPNLPSRVLTEPVAWPASADPMTEPADS
ncbi:MAG TPA: hypothetical protein VGR34_02780, partial [Candidatus Dormibacteraeota bacterium]|nr:hypothetical protein [Candidatus Dormibacteraeota bacterium]